MCLAHCYQKREPTLGLGLEKQHLGRLPKGGGKKKGKKRIRILTNANFAYPLIVCVWREKGGGRVRWGVESKGKAQEGGRRGRNGHPPNLPSSKGKESKRTKPSRPKGSERTKRRRDQKKKSRRERKRKMKGKEEEARYCKLTRIQFNKGCKPVLERKPKKPLPEPQYASLQLAPT